MTELEQLISEQDRDARSFRVHSLSVDAFPSGADIVHVPRRLIAHDPVEHGTLTGYIYWGCRCDRCRAASAAQKRAERARKRVDKGAYTYRLCCQECGSDRVERRRVYGGTA